MRVQSPREEFLSRSRFLDVFEKKMGFCCLRFAAKKEKLENDPTWLLAFYDGNFWDVELVLSVPVRWRVVGRLGAFRLVARLLALAWAVRILREEKNRRRLVKQAGCALSDFSERVRERRKAVHCLIWNLLRRLKNLENLLEIWHARLIDYINQ